MKQIKSNKSNTKLRKSIRNNRTQKMSATTIVTTESVQVDVPATPRVEEEPKYPRTLQEVAALDLSFLDDSWAAEMLRDAMKAVVLSQENPKIIERGIDAWTYLSTYDPPQGQGFMFSRGDLVVESVQHNMQVGHSGCSMAHTMRHLQLLANIGFPEYRNGYLTKKK